MTTENTRIMVILGLDERKKPHAARFETTQADAVKRAASLMGFRIGIPSDEEAEKLAGKLPAGKLFAAGRGLVPLVKAALYEQLLEKLELQPDPQGSARQSGSEAAAAIPAQGWNELKVGAVVVAPEKDAAEDGWWPAVITKVSKDGQKLTLRWRDQPRQPPITAKREAVALLFHN
jgi:hypothetical protein